jgi:hypothetical protein
MKTIGRWISREPIPYYTDAWLLLGQSEEGLPHLKENDAPAEPMPPAANAFITTNAPSPVCVDRCSIDPSLRQVGLAILLALFTLGAKAAIPEPDLVWYGKVLSFASGTPVRITTGTLVWQIEPLAGGPAIVFSTRVTNINDQFSFVLRVPCETPEPGINASTNLINLATPPMRYRRLTVTLDGQPLSLMSAAGEFAPPPTDRGRTERIDLQVGSAPVDTDGDGLADAWEQQYFGALSANPAAIRLTIRTATV